jgi:integrase
MRKKTPRIYGTGSLFRLPTGKWLFQYKPKWAPKPLSKTCEAATEKAASQLLNDWVKELDNQNGPVVSVSIHELIALHVADMQLNNCEPLNILDTERKAKKHLGAFFAEHDFTVPLKKVAIKRYKTHRCKQGAAGGTINRELSWLHRSLVLGNDEELISVAIPKIEKFDESACIRTGVINEEQYYALLRRLPSHQQPVWCIAYRTGVRKGEVLKLQTAWLLPHWKKPEPYIEIPGFDKDGNRITKSGKPHIIPLWHLEMRSLIDMVLSDPTRNPKCPYLFQYRGKRMKNIRTGFEKARREAGLDGSSQEGTAKLLFHDTCRTAVTNMDEFGIDRD